MVTLNTSTLSFTDQDDCIITPEDLILVTGANGFIGSVVVRTLLLYGFKRIRCLTRPTSSSKKLEELMDELGDGTVEIVKGNLLSREDCAVVAKDVSVIYHLAAGVEKSFPGCFLNSVVTTRNLLDEAVKEENLKRFVNVSSIAVYSNEKIRRRGLLDESAEVDSAENLIQRHEAYTYGKAKQDSLVIDYGEKKKLPYVIVRPSVVFGPGKAKVTDRIVSDTFGVKLHLGLGNRIPLTFIDNCAEAIVLAGLRNGINGEVFNITDDDLPTSRQFLKRYKRDVRRFFSIPVPYRLWYFLCWIWERYSIWSEGQLPPVFNHRGCAISWKGNRYSNKKTKELLGWEPRVPMDEALKRFFAYMRKMESEI